MENESIFIISLDLESIWGFIRYPDLCEAKLLRGDKSAGRNATDFLLRIFEKYNIPATWAIVGHLFLDHCLRENGIPHQNMPRFTSDWYSSDPCSDISKDPLYYARDIVEKIMASPVKHEIGLHSFSHVPFSECSKIVAEAEIQEGIKAAQALGIKLKSFVFPGNAIGHVDVLKENGFKIYRGENLEDLKKEQSLIMRNLNRLRNKVVANSVKPKWVDGIWEIPTSSNLSDQYVPFSLLTRIKWGIVCAMRSKSIIHVFMHPQDLLTDDSLGNNLEKLLAVVAKYRDENKLRIMTMSELVIYLDQKENLFA